MGLRIPAFLALVIAALTVGLLTPQDALFQAFVSQTSTRVQVDGAGTATAVSSQANKAVFINPRVNLDNSEPAVRGLSASVSSTGIVVPTGPGDISDGDLLVTPQDADLALNRSRQPALQRVTQAMGNLFGRLAIIIVCASVIGRCLLDSGAAEQIVKSALQILGQRMAPAAMTVSSFVLGIPVFFDTVFYLMIPIAKTLRIQTGANYLLFVLCIVAGATMAHSLVPPTPGPLTVAELLGVNIGSMMVGGMLVGFCAATGGVLWAAMLNRIWTLPLPPEDMEISEAASAENPVDLPPLWLALLPIVLPMLLIALKPVVAVVSNSTASGVLVQTLSNKNVALLLSAALSIVICAVQGANVRQALPKALQSAANSAGGILLITCAGGAFGKVLFQTNIAGLLRELPDTGPVLLVCIAFLITAAIRTAQGSATVAMMTSAGIFGPLLQTGNIGVAPLYVALAIGCGSKPISWMNDSGFWIVTQMSGMTETQGLKYISPLMTVMGLIGLLAVIAGVLLFP